uniref:Ribonuclease P/MRP protein subunit POP5 n=1 Tax=Salvator merianae TaxID=96440 RepID=A0A8D0BJD4_SALMN
MRLSIQLPGIKLNNECGDKPINSPRRSVPWLLNLCFYLFWVVTLTGERRSGPSLSLCFRYFLCEIVLDDPRCRQFIEERIVHNTVKNVVARIHGDFGLACCSIAFSVKYLNAYTGAVLLCCRKDFSRLLGSSLPFITYLENKNQRAQCSFNTLYVGATIRTCQKFLIRYNSDQLLLLLRNCTNEAEREAIQKAVQKRVLGGEPQLQSQGEDSDVTMETD